MKAFHALTAVSLVLAAGIAPAQVTSVTPFVGSLNEDFQSAPEMLGQSSVTVMGGALTINSPSSGAGVYSGSWGLGNKGFLNNPGGNVFGLGNDGSSNPFDFNFATPVSDFGGVWNAATLGASITFTFFDVNNVQIGQDVWSVPDNADFNWRGYSSTIGISRIEFTGAESVPFDNLTANAVPEPASMAALGLGGLALLRRRRKSA